MKKIAIYGKGGIGKSTIVSNLSVAFAKKGLKVMQIGCDPKADSTIALRHGETLPTVLETVRKKNRDFSLEEVVTIGYGGVACVEAGGPIPGLGCAGRGIITALEKLKEKGAYEIYQPDIVLYDVLGDVVCGGFSMPMRSGYADQVFIVTSGENMSIYAAANIAMAIDNFKGRGYAKLGGLILNKRNVREERKKVQELCGDIHTSIIGELDFSETVQEAELLNKTVLEAFPDSRMAEQYVQLAEQIRKQIEIE
ncbi:MAG: nitrogenase iron protein NifH [Lachnospiraceae bacterium]|nr:nitrogenase iron protein NifH [Lachnospiraceae bacterium]